ncbi:MAG TPA: Stp1/IreP family PP2C-type Ser/Thr phosphatase [Syntrophomonadaceae bacterium]|nr:Stp1/IreP family PP2C-type Ser/Thr phosphatase [Syntrophomonadaceae bacterium]
MLDKCITDTLQAAAISDLGRKRSNNEDRWLVSYPGTLKEKRTKGYLFIVADGMGGCASGEVASSLAVSEVEKYYYSANESDPLDVLEKALISAHRQIKVNGSKNKENSGMGTTLTAVAFIGERLCLAHVGDSRAYLIRNKNIKQLTHDHTVTAWLAARGKISPEEARIHPQRHILTQAVGGIDHDPAPDIAEFEWKDDDILLLCTDGLYSLISDEEIRQSLLDAVDLQPCIAKLIDLANERGGPDNITALVIRKRTKAPFLGRMLNNLKGLVRTGLSAILYLIA